jgi:hypothetical protein
MWSSFRSHDFKEDFKYIRDERIYLVSKVLHESHHQSDGEEKINIVVGFESVIPEYLDRLEKNVREIDSEHILTSREDFVLAKPLKEVHDWGQKVGRVKNRVLLRRELFEQLKLSLVY